MSQHAARQPILLIADFDGTLTNNDTLNFLGEYLYNYQVARRPNGSEGLPTWNEIVEAYAKDFEAHKAGYRPAAEERTTVEQEIAWLRSLKDIEERSWQRVNDAGYFEGVSRADIDAAVAADADAGPGRRKIVLKRCWFNLFKCIHNQNIGMGGGDLRPAILSVNWSSSFIKSCLRHSYEDIPRMEGSERERYFQIMNDRVDIPIIVANEIPELAADEGMDAARPGWLIDSIRTSEDKVNALRALQEFYSTSGEEEGEMEREKPLVIYLGDSCTDLQCLLAADVGVCMRAGLDQLSSRKSERELGETCDRLGILVRYSLDYLPLCSRPENSMPVLAWAWDTDEVLRKVLTH